MLKRILITIGRQTGSGGKRVATALGERLGIPVYDNELITRAAQKSGLSESFFKQSDERRSFLHLGNIFGAPRYGDFGRNVLNESELFRIQSETIREIASQGSAIFVGRASDYVLRDIDSLDVFLNSPLEVRVDAVAGREGISRQEAEELILKKDKRRKDYYDLITMGDNWGVASNYDLCIDSSVLGIDGTADFIIRFGQAAGRI
ncbi:MAG: cytidylate kinase-like family protein [Bacteroidales bacterium]|nr:cytidylate kinase-like family protein [Bacteroidales bacterium]